MTDPALRLRAVVAYTGRSKTRIYDGMKKGDFPRPIRLRARAVAWRQSDLDRWLASRPRTDA